MMTGELRYHPGFLEDVEQVVRWYAAEEPELGPRFANRVNSALDEISVNPTAHALVVTGLRVAQLRPFPYGIFFEVMGPVVLVIAVRHLHRRPSTFRHRRSS